MTIRRQLAYATGVATTVAATLAVLGEPLLARNFSFFAVLVGFLVVGAAGYLVYRSNPAWTISIAVGLSVFAGNWDSLGIPGALSPNRLLLLGGIAVVLMRGPGVADRPHLSPRRVHWVMAAIVAYATVSALAAGKLFERSTVFSLLEQLGVFPFLVFVVAPVVFARERDRKILIGVLVTMGGYLGLTALFETIGLRSLLVPAYIGDPNVGLHIGRARGPFVEAVSNGVGLCAGALAAVVALMTWRDSLMRFLAMVVLGLCAAGGLFTLQRSVWLASLVTALVMLVAVEQFRRVALPTVAALLAVVFIAFTAIPGLSAKAKSRQAQQETVWDRQNQTRAAENMIAARPLIGFGWGQFPDRSIDYYQQSDDYPVSAAGLNVHNAYLRYATELGLFGLALWLLTLVLGVGGALLNTRRGLEPWRVALLAFAVFFAVISAFVPAQLFPNLMLWLLAGVVSAAPQDP